MRSKYWGVKKIEAEPVTLGEYRKMTSGAHRASTINGEDDAEGYFVVYPDGYISFSPKDIFEAAYFEVDGLDYAERMMEIEKRT